MFAHVGPDGEQHALPFVVAGTILVRLAKVPHHDGAIYRTHDLGEGDFVGRASQYVAAAHPTFGADQPGALEGEKDLLEVGLGEHGSVRDVSHRGWGAVGVHRERKQRPACVVTTGRHLHPGESTSRYSPVGACGSLAAARQERNVVDNPVLPDYTGACIANIVPALLDGAVDPPPWLPAAALEADQVVLLVLDGLGWDQLQARPHLAPTLSAMVGGPITSVTPTTTATALTSIATGLTPGEHGVVGYRVAVDHEVLNILRWTTAQGDARKRIDPHAFQPTSAFCSQRPCIVTKAEFVTSGFSGAHLGGVRFTGYRVPSTLVVEIRHALKAREPFIYAYYDGIDKVAHEYGLADHYDAELQAVDRLVADVLAELPRGAVLVITADHGQVSVGENLIDLHADVAAHVSFQSGEGRFRWLHARPGRADALAEASRARHSDTAWVRERDETIDDGWWGPKVADVARQRLGDVALVARADVSYVDAADTGPFKLIGRHGSLTAAEMYVPLLVGEA